MRRGKIVDTIGPASNSYDTLKKMAEAGMNIARLNRSHGTQEEHLVTYNNLRKVAQELDTNIGVLVDRQGPKIRCGWFPENENGEDESIYGVEEFNEEDIDDYVRTYHQKNTKNRNYDLWCYLIINNDLLRKTLELIKKAFPDFYQS